MADFVARHEDRGTAVATDTACKWDKPRKTSRPLAVREVDFSTPAAKKKRVAPPCSLKKLNEGVLMQDYMDLLGHDSDCVATQILPLPLPEPDTPQPNLISLIKKHYCPGMTAKEVMAELAPEVDDALASKVESATRGQADNTEWFHQRLGRLTASKFHDASRCKGNGRYIVRSVLGNGGHVKTDAMAHGIEHEGAARQLYIETHLATHKKGLCVESGLHLCLSNPRYAASPDGLVSCQCCGEGLLEIKCTSKFKHLTVCEVASQPGYHFEQDENGQPVLKQNSSWYDQVQGQLYVTQREWCDFVLYTLNGPLSVQRIYVDEDWVASTIPKLDIFFDSKIFPALLNHQ